MKKISLLAAMLLVVGLVGGASAHVGDPPGTVYFAFQFEDGSAPSVDGSGDDWAFVPDFYWIGAEKWNLAQRGDGGGDFDPTEADLATFNPSAVYGWNDTANRVYLLVQAIDDYHEIDRVDNNWTWTDDDLEIRWSAGHFEKSEFTGGGELNTEGTNRIEHLFAVPPIPTGEFFFGDYDVSYNVPNGPIMDFAYSFEGVEIGAGASTYWYEYSLEIPWTWTEELADVTFLDLEEGYVLHAAAYLNDRDGDPDVEVFWTTGTQGNNQQQQDLQMAEIDDSVDQLPTAVEGSSWGLIKAGFTK
jgi:hypothetical protein